MKLNAVTNRGSKKDFYDTAALLDCFPLETKLQFYEEKYRPATLLMPISAASPGSKMQTPSQTPSPCATTLGPPSN